MAAQAGTAGVVLACGLSAAAVTMALVGPMLQDGIQNSLSGDLLNDLVVTCGTIAAGGILVATGAGVGGGLAFPVVHLMPSAAPILGGLVGGATGAFLARRLS